MIVSHLLLILHKKIQFYIFMFEASNVTKGRKVQGVRIISQVTVYGCVCGLLLCGIRQKQLPYPYYTYTGHPLPLQHSFHACFFNTVHSSKSPFGYLDFYGLK